MNKIIDYLIKQIELNNSSISNSKEELSKLEKIISILEEAIKKPDQIDENEFNEIFNNDESLSDIFFYKGWFESNSTEPQIIETVKYLKEIVNNKINEINAKKEKINNDISSSEQSNEKNDGVLKFLQGYNKDTYVDNETLDKINEIVFLIDMDDEIVRLFIDIAINNSIIENARLKEEQENESLSDEQITAMSNARQRVGESLEEKNIPIDKKEDFIKKVNAFKNNEEYRTLDEDLYSKSTEIIGLINTIEYDSDDIELLLIDSSDFEALTNDARKYLILKTCMELLKNFEEGNTQKINEVLGIYNRIITTEDNSRDNEIDLEKLLKDNGLGDLVVTLKSIRDTYNIEDYINDNKNKIHSMSGLTKDEIKQVEPNITDEEIKMINLSSKCMEIYYLIKDGIINEEIKKELLQKNLELLKISSQTKDDDSDTIISPTSDEIISAPTLEPKPYSNDDFKNYVIIFNDDEFEKSYKKAEEKTEGFEKSYFATLVTRKINTLINTSLSEIHHHKNSHIINERPQKPNEYGIFDLILGGKTIRATYKLLDNAIVASDSDKKHGVILLFTTCYGRTKKDDDLIKSLNIFKRDSGQKRFSYLKKIFSDESYIEEQQAEIDKSRTKFEEIYNKQNGMGTL